MQTNEIKALMVLKGVKTIDIARHEGVTRTWVSLVLNRHARSRRIRKAIAKALGVSYKDLWGEEEK